jgi:hypothetical protein
MGWQRAPPASYGGALFPRLFRLPVCARLTKDQQTKAEMPANEGHGGSYMVARLPNYLGQTVLIH